MATNEQAKDQFEQNGHVAKKRGPVAGTDEARRGGEAVREKYGHDFFSKIGRIGGKTVAKQHGPEFYAQIGKKGGESTKRNQGPEFYARIGRKGGLISRPHGGEGQQGDEQ